MLVKSLRAVLRFPEQLMEEGWPLSILSPRFLRGLLPDRFPELPPSFCSLSLSSGVRPVTGLIFFLAFYIGKL